MGYNHTPSQCKPDASFRNVNSYHDELLAVLHLPAPLVLVAEKRYCAKIEAERTKHINYRLGGRQIGDVN